MSQYIAFGIYRVDAIAHFSWVYSIPTVSA